MPLDKGLPVPLTDDHGTLWVDNGDGTVTNTQDTNDGHPDQDWDAVDVRSAIGLHGFTCRRWNLRSLCMGGWECAEAERIELLTHARHRALLGSFA